MSFCLVYDCWEIAMQINMFFSYLLKEVAPAKPLSLISFINSDWVCHPCMCLETLCYIQMMKKLLSPLCDKDCSTRAAEFLWSTGADFLRAGNITVGSFKCYCVTKSLCSLGEEFCWTLGSNLTSVLIALNTFCTLELILSDLFSKLITDRNSYSRREWTISSLKDSFSGSIFRVRKVECFLESHFSPSLFG